VFSLIVILLVVFAGLSLLLAAWTLFFQGYIYSEPVEAIYWRAPAAGAALTIYLLIWMVLDYRSIEKPSDEGRYRALQEFSSGETETYEKLAIIGQDRKTAQYTLSANKKYLNKAGRSMPERPLEIIATDKDGKDHLFKPPTDDKGNFKVEKGQSLRYYEEGNPDRYMEESSIGRVTVYHSGWLVVELLLNVVFLVVWFLCMWLLLRFQWPHALGLAFVAWLISIFVLPMLLTQAEKVRKERLAPAQTAALVIDRSAAR
jgi:hypothetical protein